MSRLRLAGTISGALWVRLTPYVVLCQSDLIRYAAERLPLSWFSKSIQQNSTPADTNQCRVPLFWHSICVPVRVMQTRTARRSRASCARRRRTARRRVRSAASTCNSSRLSEDTREPTTRVRVRLRWLHECSKCRSFSGAAVATSLSTRRLWLL